MAAGSIKATAINWIFISDFDFIGFSRLNGFYLRRPPPREPPPREPPPREPPMLWEPRLKLEEAELLLKPPPLLKALLLRGLGECDCRLFETRSPPLGPDGRVVGRL